MSEQIMNLLSDFYGIEVGQRRLITTEHYGTVISADRNETCPSGFSVTVRLPNSTSDHWDAEEFALREIVGAER